MKIKINTIQEISVHGKSKEYCGSENNYCRFAKKKLFFKNEYYRTVFSRKIKHDSNDFLRCKECRESGK
jgi:hypothetical protein